MPRVNSIRATTSDKSNSLKPQALRCPSRPSEVSPNSFSCPLRYRTWCGTRPSTLSRVHILVSRDRHLAPDALQGQALQDAADVDKLENHPGLQDEMNTLVAACQTLGERHSFGWSVPGCTKYRPSFDTISSTLSQVCTESRRVFQEYRERRTMTRLMKWSKLSVDERDSISAFATRRTPGIQQRQQPRGSWRRRRDSHPRSWPSSSRFTQTIEPSEGSLPTFRLNCRCG